MKPAVILIDLEREFVKNGRLLENKDDLVSCINELTEFARSKNYPVIWVTQEFEKDLSDAPIGSRKPGLMIPIKDTQGSKLLEGLVVNDGDLHIIKKRYSAFFKTDLDKILEGLPVDSLIMAGINTHACVRTSVIDAYQRDYPVTIALDCTDSYDEEHHDISIKYLTRNISEGKTNQEIFDEFS
ncbi:MAG: cysteine hydrolase [bacterium]|nr:cysteine hydrolase [bacterium]